jgi:hypothetical protein
VQHTESCDCTSKRLKHLACESGFPLSITRLDHLLFPERRVVTDHFGVNSVTLMSITLVALTNPVGIAATLNIAVCQGWLSSQSAVAVLTGLMSGASVAIAALIACRLSQTLITA